MENYKWVNYKTAKYGNLMKPVEEPKIDREASQIAGVKVHANDPRLIKIVIEFRNKKNPDNEDNYFKNPEFRQRLREVFNPGQLNETQK